MKLLRECTNTKVLNSEIDSREFGWKCNNIEMNNTSIISEYIFLDSKNVKLDNVKFQGKYSFQYMENLEISNSVLDTKVAADIKGNVISIKNPKSGTITVDSVGEIITEDPVMECNGKVIIRNKEEEIA